jgi:hypothetical protein
LVKPFISSYSSEDEEEEKKEKEEVRPKARQPSLLARLDMGLEYEDVDLTVMNG